MHPATLGGYAAAFDKAYALDNAEHMIQRVENGTMPPSGVVSDDLVPAIQAWIDGGYQD